MFLTQLDQKRLDHLATDDSFLAHLKMIYEDFYRRVISPRQVMDPYFKGNEVIAYFSMEFGIHESLPFFAGGLGVLAGDHLKSSSNISLPMVGICLLYIRGYFRQYLNHEGWQQEDYPETDSFHIPMQRAHGIDGKPLRVAATGPLGEIYANVWKINIGRIPLYLLDTNTHENSPEAQNITERLYTGNLIQRLSQEVILGIGGMRALKAMGYYPKVIHMN